MTKAGTHRTWSTAVIVAAVLWLSGGLAAQGQPDRITVAGRAIDVERDGDFVRVRTPGQQVEASGDWRQRRTVHRIGDSERILIELGAREGDDSIRMALSGDVLFDFNSAAIRPDAAETLGKIAHVIRERSRGDVFVVGHTDSVGADSYNQTLSEDRAAAVIGWLSLNEGIPASIMLGRGMGKSQPVAGNTTAEGSDSPQGRAQNRRVEILLATTEGVDLRSSVGTTSVGLAATGVAVERGPGGQTVQVGGRTIGIQQGAAGQRVQIAPTPGGSDPAAADAPPPAAPGQRATGASSAAAPQATAPTAGERRRGTPVQCTGAEVVEVSSVVIETPGLAIEASGACRVTVRNSEIRSQGVAVGASGSAQVHFIDSVVVGRGTAIQASGTAQISGQGTEFRGEVSTSGLATFDDRGGNRLP